ncbi:hypothetical protein [Xanthomonas phage SB4]|uniref:Uncharacterized protein n=1 Tax=Xanthomonas phage SB4 TaxID=3117473 RepID=A0ABZ2GWR9_9CAUD
MANPALKAAQKATESIERKYNERVRLGGDKDDAVTDAIKHAYPSLSEDAQADVFGRIRDLFDEFPSGITRKMALGKALRDYAIGRIYG